MAVERVGVSFEPELLERFDAIVKGRGYASRSEAIRDLVRREIINSELEGNEGPATGTLTFVYDHDHSGLAGKLLQVQHMHHHCISSSTHIHMDEHACLEVLVLKGSSGELGELADSILSLKGVKHGKLFLTTGA